VIQVYVQPLERTTVWDLTVGQEWESFESQMKEALGEDEWRVSLDGADWVDSSRAPNRGHTIEVSCRVHGANQREESQQ
jgi:hypothetical protein